MHKVHSSKKERHDYVPTTRRPLAICTRTLKPRNRNGVHCQTQPKSSDAMMPIRKRRGGASGLKLMKHLGDDFANARGRLQSLVYPIEFPVVAYGRCVDIGRARPSWRSRLSLSLSALFFAFSPRLKPQHTGKKSASSHGKALKTDTT